MNDQFRMLVGSKINDMKDFCDFVVVIDDPFVIDPLSVFNVNQHFLNQPSVIIQKDSTIAVRPSSVMIIQTFVKTKMQISSKISEKSFSVETNPESVLFFVSPIFESISINVDFLDNQLNDNQKNSIKIQENKISDEFMSLLTIPNLRLIFPILNTTMAITLNDFFVNVVQWPNLKYDLMNRGKRSLDLLEIEKRSTLIDQNKNDASMKKDAMNWKTQLVQFLLQMNKMK